MTKNATREELLQRGFELFHVQGYNATGIQEITDAVKVSKGSFYNHFKKKEKFVVELIENFGRQLAEEHRVALENKKLKPLERIQEFYMKKVDGVIHRHHFLKGCFISNMCQEEADTSDVIARSVDVAFNDMQVTLRNCLDEAKEQDEISLETDTDLLAEFILNSWNGALMRVKASRNEKALKSFMLFIKSLKS